MPNSYEPLQSQVRFVCDFPSQQPVVIVEKRVENQNEFSAASRYSGKMEKIRKNKKYNMIVKTSKNKKKYNIIVKIM